MLLETKPDGTQSAAAAAAGRNPQLDFVRGIAILMVMGFHAVTVPSNAFFRALEYFPHRCGWAGVDLFFVLSGFLVGGLLLKEMTGEGELRPQRFLTRRAFKIWPAYYAYILFELVFRVHPPSTFALANLLHLQNYLGTSLKHTWSLAVEEHFYLALALGLSFMAARRWTKKKILIALFAAILTVICIRCVLVLMYGPGLSIEWATHTRIDSILFGVILATLYRWFPGAFRRLTERKWPLLILAAAAIAMLLTAGKDSVPMQTIGYTVLYLGAGGGMLLVYCHTASWSTAPLFRWVAKIGLYSYGIYLWHNGVHSVAMKLTLALHGSARWVALYVLQIGLGIAAGVVTTRLIEWPMLKIRERIAPARDTGAPVAAGPRVAVSAPAGMASALQERL